MAGTDVTRVGRFTYDSDNQSGIIKRSYSFSYNEPNNITRIVGGVQSIGTSEEHLDLGADYPGSKHVYLILQNLDPTNYVQLGVATADYVVHVAPLDFIMVYLIVTDYIFIKANSAACRVEFSGVYVIS